MAPWWVGGFLNELVYLRVMETPFGFSSADPTLPLKDLPTEFSKSPVVATLQPYVANSLSQRIIKNSRAKPRKNEFEIMPGIFEPVSFNKFLTLKFEDDKRAQDLDMFAIEKQIVAACGREPNIMFQSDGSLLIEVMSPEEGCKLQGLAIIDGIAARCTPHKSLNHCKGVIRSTHLLKYTEERLLKEFEAQNVVEVRQMKKFIDGVLTPLPTYILTFNLVKLPQKIKAAWLRLQVRPYIPTPRRCFYCQKFGHISNSCRRKLKDEKKICNNCGQEEHGECTVPSFCVNCAGNHPASSKTCDRFVLEQEIQAVKAKENIPFPEAKRMVLDQFIRPGVSFASVLQKAKRASNANMRKSTPKRQSSPEMNPPTKSDVTASLKSKRKLSDDDQDVSPSSKSNRFENLIDEMDSESIDCNNSDDIQDETLSNVCPSSLMVNNASSCILVQAEIHAPLCSTETMGSSAPVDLGESAGATSLGSSVELSGTPFLGGSGGLPGELLSGGSDELLRGEPAAGLELAGAAALAGSGEPSGTDESGEMAVSADLPSLHEKNIAQNDKNIKTQSLKKVKVGSNVNPQSSKKDEVDSNKSSPKSMSSRKLKVPKNSNKDPQRQNKNLSKNASNKTSDKGSLKP